MRARPALVDPTVSAAVLTAATKRLPDNAAEEQQKREAYEAEQRIREQRRKLRQVCTHI